MRRQARFERRSGPDVVVKSSVGITAITGVGVLTVRANNTGRGAIQVTGWGFYLPDRRSIFELRPMQGSSPLPLTLDGGHQGRWMMPVTPESPIVPLNDAEDTVLTPYADLGDGSTVEGETLTLGRGALRRLIE